MLSIIVSSVSDEIFSKFSSNVSNTIGCTYEIIKIENKTGEIGICEAYNIGASKAQYPFLCFIHEDVSLKTTQWGNKLIQHLMPDDIGIAGIAGTIYKGRMVSGWWQRFNSDINLERVNIAQNFKHSKREREVQFSNPDKEVISEVISLDGVMLAMKKKTWHCYPFDQSLLKGFHGYDLDISLTVGQFSKNIVIYDIHLEHFSEGVTDLNWFYSLLKVHYKFRKILPRTHLVEHQKLLPKRNDWETINLYVEKMINDNLSIRQLLNNYYKLLRLVDYKTGTAVSFIKNFLTTSIVLIWRLLKRTSHKFILLS